MIISMIIIIRGQGKWLTGAVVWLRLKICSYVKRLFYKQTHVLNQSIAVLRRSVGILGQIKPDTQTHPTTYCNTAAHARQGLNITTICIICGSLLCQRMLSRLRSYSYSITAWPQRWYKINDIHLQYVIFAMKCL